MLFVTSIISGALALLSLALLYLPPTLVERKLWQTLNIRALRHWATRNQTERWAQKGSLSNVVERSRRNIAWHTVLTFPFCFLMIRAQATGDGLLQYGSQILLLPPVFYFVGSLIQREKITIVLIRRRQQSTRAHNVT